MNKASWRVVYFFYKPSKETRGPRRTMSTDRQIASIVKRVIEKMDMYQRRTGREYRFDF